MTVLALYFAVYVIVLAMVGLYAGRRLGTEEDEYTLAGRKLGKYVVGLSAGATGNSGFIMLGAVGLGYMFGLTFLFLPVLWLVGDLVFWRWCPQKLNALSRETSTQTVPGLLASSASNSGKSVAVIAALLLVVSVGVYGASQLLAASKALDAFFGLDRTWGAVLTVAIVTGYCVWGGLKSSVWTDVVQAVIMLGVMCVVVVAGMCEVGGPSGFFRSATQIAPGFLTPFAGWHFLIVGAFIVTWPLAALGFGLSQPHVVVRYFAGRSPEETAKAKWVYIAFLQVTWIGMTFFGCLARLTLDRIEDPEIALPVYVLERFHPAFSALVLAGIFSAIASTFDSILLAIGNVISVDIVRSFRTKKALQSVMYHRAVVVLAAAAMLAGCVFTTQSVFVVSAYAVTFVSSVVGPAMLLRLVNRGDKRALLVAMTTSATVFVLWNLSGLSAKTGAFFPGFECVPAFIAGVAFGLAASARGVVSGRQEA